MINVDTCRWVIWGARPPANTFGYIHQAYVRALRYLGKDVIWLDGNSDLSNLDLSNSLFVALACDMNGLPKRKDSFYFIHNALGTKYMQYFEGLKTLHYGLYVSTNSFDSTVEEVAPEMFYNPAGPSLVFRWGTDLLPFEIEANKPTRVFNSESKVVNFVGTVYPNTLNEFRRACLDNGIDFKRHGEGVSIEDNIALTKASYLAPALQQACHVDIGYVPCRLFKNISYGQFGITNSKYSNDLFKGKLVFNTDTYQLFHDAKERLSHMPLSELHSLMDEVAKKHTYVNKIQGIIKTIRMMGDQ